ncbi:MAG: SUMF1/EgtB/PvdO family nonheme iron enzyme [Thermoguttaceae bacterium]|nr:SUMF1/EgtB/PvdO family nonheme iron enzyme [Thermoguttaceae bacterium]
MKRINQRRLRGALASAFGLVALGLIPLEFGGAEQNATLVFAQDASVDEMILRGLVGDEEVEWRKEPKERQEPEERKEAEIEAQAQNNFASNENAINEMRLLQEYQNWVQQGYFAIAIETTNALLQRDDVKNYPPAVQNLQTTKFLLQKLELLFPQGMAPWRSAKAGERRVLNIEGVELAFRYCPAGTFTMGAPASESRAGDRERQHQVTLSRGFWISETEITQRMWKAICGNNPSVFQNDAHPVENVDWFDCQLFCVQLNERIAPQLTLFAFCLPTEAQWEYACRAGSVGRFCDGSEDGGQVGWVTDVDLNGLVTQMGSPWELVGQPSKPVARKKPNAWGIYDMHGNVAEWCWDWYADNAYATNKPVDPTGPEFATGKRVIRGGPGELLDFCRSAARNYANPADNGVSAVSADFRGQVKQSWHGFRLVFREMTMEELAQLGNEVTTALPQRQMLEQEFASGRTKNPALARQEEKIRTAQDRQAAENYRKSQESAAQLQNTLNTMRNETQIQIQNMFDQYWQQYQMQQQMLMR